MKMPDGLGGLELAEILTTQKPRLKVLYTSGYSPDLVQGGFVLREDMNFLPKPYPPEKLLSAVRNCLVEEKKTVTA
jgi:DNA-binding NtrC family response regulator